MARKRNERDASKIKLKQPDRSGPSEETLIQLAEQRGLFAQALKKEDANKRAVGKAIAPDEGGEDEDEGVALSPTAERILETLLWTVSLAMLHFTLDVLVQNQFSIDRIQWPKIWTRAGQALLGRLPLQSCNNVFSSPC